MKLPSDWDKPSPDNHILCARFGYGSFEDRGLLKYRLFKPKAAGKVPLVIYLHGADAFGNDNEQQLEMHDIGTMFARDSWQDKHPAYILAPQCKPSGHWAGPESGRRLCALIAELIKEHPDIDADRLYIYGYSAGGIGILRLLKDNPGLFAAAIPICGATDTEDLDKLIETPMWLFHAEDDKIVKVTYRGDSFFGINLGSRDIYAELKNKMPGIRYTEYPAGYMHDHYGINPHCTWVPVSENLEAMEWLFKMKR